MVNGWKSQAENAFALGWTDSTEAEMIRMQRVRATADAGRDVMPLLMQKAAAEKTGVTAPDALPPAIRGLNVAAAVSVGSGSACMLYTQESDFIRIDYLLANTQAAGQSIAQQALIRHVSEIAQQSGAEVRLSSTALPTLYAAPAELGFEELAPGAPWLRLART